LIVNTGHYGAVAYYHGPAYGAQKAGSDKMAADMAKELHPTTSRPYPSGWEASTPNAHAPTSQVCRRMFARRAKRESPQFTGRVIAALYASEKLMSLSGRALIGAELGAVLGVTDVDAVLRSRTGTRSAVLPSSTGR